MIKIYAKGQKRDVNASAIFEDEHSITVLKGSVISKTSSNFKMAKDALNYRNMKELFDKGNILKKDIKFSSASSAAQFVSGYSVNGLNYWKDEKGNKLVNIIKKK